VPKWYFITNAILFSAQKQPSRSCNPTEKILAIEEAVHSSYFPKIPVFTDLLAMLVIEIVFTEKPWTR